MKKILTILSLVFLSLSLLAQTNATYSKGPYRVGKPSSWTSSTSYDTKNFNPVDYGAVGDFNGSTGADNTAAFQAALNAVGTFAYTNPYYYLITSAGGGKVTVPHGRYKITGTLRYPAGVTIEGDGIGTELAFRPAVSDTLFVADLSKKTRGTGDTRTVESVRFKDLLLTGDYNGNEGIWSVNTERLICENLTIEGFKTGIYIGGIGGAAYYHEIRECIIRDCTTSIYLDSGSACTNIYGGHFTHTAAFSGAKYNIYINNSGLTNIFGSSIEGKVDSAQIFDASKGLSVFGAYHEMAGDAGEVFIWKKVNPASSYGTHIYGFGNNIGSVIFENFDLTASDADQYTGHSGDVFEIGDPKFLPIIDNGNLKSGDVTGFTQIGSKNHGTVTFDNTHFRSYGSIKLTRDAGADGDDNRFYLTLDTTELRPYQGARIYISALVKKTATTAVTMYAGGAGGTSTKFGGPVVDYGNGWSLWVIDLPIIDHTSTLDCAFYQTTAVPGDITYVTNIQAFQDGIDYIPISRDVGVHFRILPVASPPTPAYEGMIYMDTDHHLYVYNGTGWIQLDN